MTIDEFLLELKRHTDLTATRWVENDGLIRCGESDTYACPLTFLCFELKGKRFNPCDHRTATKVLGLLHEDGFSIANSADNLREQWLFNLSIRKTLESLIVWRI